jgi:hypothetical protein
MEIVERIVLAIVGLMFAAGGIAWYLFGDGRRRR